MLVGILGLLLILVSGVVLLVVGVRGVRVGNHPVCRRCGFDLFGMPSGVSICSECGSDVSQPGAIRIGHRKRKPGSILVGILLLLGFCSFAGFWGWQSSQNINWEEHLPSFWLIHETASSDALTRDPALAELLRRMQAGNLSDSQAQKLVKRGLAFQADTTKPWVIAWGDIVEAAHIAGRLTNEQWNQYAQNATDVRLTARPRVRQGDVGVPVSLSDGQGRVGNTCTLYVQTDGADNGSDLAEGKRNSLFGGSSSLSSRGGGSEGTQLMLDQALVAKAPLGRKFARIKLKVKIFSSYQDLTFGSGVPPIAERMIVLQAPWELVAADAPTVQPINDDKYRAAVAHSLKVGHCEISGSGQNTFCDVEIDCAGSPVPLAYHVILRTNGREVPAGSIDFPAGSPGGYGSGQSCPNLTASQVEIILRPSASVCASTINLTSYWNGEITIPHVPLTHR